MELKRTVLYQRHLECGGRMVDFGGWLLPVEYKSMLSEARSVRSSCGIFDASHMGEIIVEGNGAFDFLQKFTCNDLSLISESQQQYNLLLNSQGGIIDDLMIYRQEKSFLCVVNASNKDKVYAYLNKQKLKNVELIDESDNIALLCVQGPNSAKIIENVFGRQICNLNYLCFYKGQVEKKEVLISRSGYTGEDGFEIYVAPSDAIYWWDRIITAGCNFGLMPCGLGARDILRIEAGYSLYGHEIDDTTNPYEASLGWVVKLDKDFIGKEEIMKAKNKKDRRKRVGFVMQQRVPARHNYRVIFEGREIGRVTSAASSPNLDKFIGMAYLDKDYVKVDAQIEIEIRNKLYSAKVTKFPFIEIRTKKT